MPRGETWWNDVEWLSKCLFHETPQLPQEDTWGPEGFAIVGVGRREFRVAEQAIHQSLQQRHEALPSFNSDQPSDGQSADPGIPEASGRRSEKSRHARLEIRSWKRHDHCCSDVFLGPSQKGKGVLGSSPFKTTDHFRFVLSWVWSQQRTCAAYDGQYKRHRLIDLQNLSCTTTLFSPVFEILWTQAAWFYFTNHHSGEPSGWLFQIEASSSDEIA